MKRLTTLALCLAITTSAHADERLKGIACRSVHLGYDFRDATAFYNEVTVEKSAPGTYFCVCGFRMGYFGIQELADEKKVVIFSVWDSGSGKEADRVNVLHKGEGVRVGRFGNEGTGAQSFFELNWKPGETHRFLMKAEKDGDRTAFSAYVHLGDDGWKHLATFSTLASGKLLEGGYSFVEDFRRNRVSATKERRAAFGNVWVRDAEGHWDAITSARFTADGNPVMNIDAGFKGGRFFLATGGDVKNESTKLRSRIELDGPPVGVELP